MGAPILKQNLLITCAALTVFTIFTAFLLTAPGLSAPTPAEQTGEPLPDLPQSDDPPSSVQYYLREYQGRLAVFLPEQSVPEKVFDVYLSTLPPYDRGQLQLGVPISDFEEMVQRIEDYIS